MEVFNNLTVNKEFIYSGTFQKFNDDISKFKNGSITKTGKNKYKVTPKISWGTLLINNLPIVEGINVKINATPLPEDKVSIKLTTSIRIEHFFIITLFVAFIIFIAIKNESFLQVLFFIAMWILCHVWFQWIYRAQENALIDELTRTLKIKKENYRQHGAKKMPGR